MRFALVLLVLLSASASAQTRTLSGTVVEAGSEEPLPGASVSVAGARAVANAHGYVSLRVSAADSATVTVRSVGFEVFRRPLGLLLAEARSGAVTIRLDPAPLSAGAAEVTAATEALAIIGAQTIPIDVIERLPAGGGEVDVVRVYQLLPGVRGGTEGTAGLFVRGGSPDQTLTRLDGATVYNASHLFGFFSVFNPAAVKRVDLIKGSLPARFGGRLGSVLDVQMREGDAGGLSGEAAVGLISSHGALEGPLRLGAGPGARRGTFAISARRTYVDLILRPFQSSTSNGGYAFWDANAKASHPLSPRDRLLAGLYTGRDALVGRSRDQGDRSRERLAWGNTTATLRWTRRLGDRAFAETTLLASTYGLGVLSLYEPASGRSYRSEYESRLSDVGGSARVEIAGERVQTTRLGVEVTRHGYRPGATRATETAADGTEALREIGASARRQTTEGAAYLEADLRRGALLLNAGARATAFVSDGQTFGSVEPRLSARLGVSPRLAASASVATATQYVHLLVNPGIGLPTDLWLPATQTVGPERGAQASFGLAWDAGRGAQISAEAYARRMRGLIDYRDGAGVFNTAFENWEAQVTPGEGRALGLELLAQQTAGRTTGWVGYTLARTDRRFAAFGDAWFPYRYDRRHDLSVVVVHRASARTSLSATWVYGTGDALTLPVGRAPAFVPPPLPNGGPPPSDGTQSGEIDVLTGRGQFRLPAMHRLDVSATFRRRTRLGERTITLGAYNAYYRANPAYVTIDRRLNRIGDAPATPDNPDPALYVDRVRLKQHGLLPLVPALAYRLQF